MGCNGEAINCGVMHRVSPYRSSFTEEHEFCRLIPGFGEPLPLHGDLSLGVMERISANALAKHRGVHSAGPLPADSDHNSCGEDNRRLIGRGSVIGDNASNEMVVSVGGLVFIVNPR